MVASRAPLSVLDGFLWALRREGVAVSTAQAIDAMNAAKLVGFDSKDALKDALRAFLAHAFDENARFDDVFERYFSQTSTKPDLWERLLTSGVRAEEIAELRRLFTTHAPTLSHSLTREADFEWLLSRRPVAEVLADVRGPSHVGVYSHRLLEAMGLADARILSFLVQPLEEAFGSERAKFLLSALTAEVRLTQEELRRRVVHAAEENANPRQASPLRTERPLSELSAEDVEEVRRALREFMHRLKGAMRSRAKKHGKDAIDLRRTMRLAARTGGVPLRLAKRSREREKPKLVFLCDVSDSVRNVSLFLLEIAYLARELAPSTRTFAFVSQVAETTSLFRDHTSNEAVSRIQRGAVVSLAHNSNYGNAFASFLYAHGDTLDRQTTLVVLGDGRTNYAPNGVGALGELRKRVRKLVFFCPEPRAMWGLGDSAMNRYETIADAVQVRDAGELFRACRELF